MSSFMNNKEQVVFLRKSGKTYSEIKKILNKKIPKSTLSDWCKNIQLSNIQKKRIEIIKKRNLLKIQMKKQEEKKEKHRFLVKEMEQQTKKELVSYQKDQFKMLLAILYLGEGAKYPGHIGLMLGNTDPVIIKLYIKLLNLCYEIKTSQLKCRVSYRADQNIKELEKYWSEITGIPLKGFYKTKPDPRTIGKKTKKPGYKGVCVITCAGAKIQIELDVISKVLLKNLGPVA